MPRELPFQDEVLSLLYRHWLELRGERAMPARRDFNPIRLPGFTWPFIILMEVIPVEGRRRYRYRRVGGHYVDAVGRDPTGSFVDEGYQPGYQRYLVGIYDQLVAERKALYSENTTELETQIVPALTRRLMLPLSENGRDVDMVMVGHRFVYDAATAPKAFLSGAEFKIEHKRIVLGEA